MPWMDLEPLLKYPKQIFFDDVNVGDKLPSITKPRTTTARVAIYDASYADFCAWHFDDHTAQAQGHMPWAFDYGQHTCDYLASLMTDWIGSEGFLKKLSVRQNIPVWAGDGWADTLGDQITLMGEVTKKYVQDNENCVDCTISAQRQDGVLVAIGTATAALPSRTGK